MDRNIGQVIDRMIKAIHDNDSELVDQLRNVGESMKYAAPETLCFYWDRLAVVVNERFNPHYELLSDWQKEVVDIFTAKK